ncbi:MAG: glycosyltransferase family 4 protein [Sedimentisphaerales bacterium]|nr:glycosyltransferase family 4 protein [Sedimentisphaerales bacterium]
MENSLRFIGRELLHSGHEVKVFCFQISPDEPLRMEHEGIEIIRHRHTLPRWPHAQFLESVAAAQEGIPAVLRQYQPDAIWCRSASVGLGIRRGGYRGRLIQIFCTNARMNCRALYLQTHGLPVKRRLMLLALWPSAYIVSSRLERELASECEAVVFSENMRRQLLAGFSNGDTSCHVIPPGVDDDLFSPENGARYFEQIRQRYGLQQGQPIILYVGRIESAKHIPILMDAVARLDRSVKLVLVGSGRDEARLKAYASRIGLSDRSVFTGPQYELLPGFYAISRVFVLPTMTESFGQVFLESLASGTPAVGFAGDGRRVLTATDEIIRDGRTGAVAHEISAPALAEKIAWILSLDDRAYAVMSQRARQDVQERFSWGRFVEGVLRLSAEYSSAPLEDPDMAPSHDQRM